ncbi:hypothetical protein STSP_71960 [Streptomyces jeddahensis]|uniref:Uncharacterized protein n=1 Tax=Streptomyces jeddahensis TaxID=1716141 RepID=A0A177HFE3_9ACTN|nr:hypothetical protein STSP_71960 [Streptomyces jeddahensis]
MTSPALRRASAADRDRVLTARATSLRAWVMVLPASLTISWAKDSARCSIRWAARSRTEALEARDSAAAVRRPHLACCRMPPTAPASTVGTEAMTSPV